MQTAGGRALTPARGTLLRVTRSSKLSAVALAATATSFVALAFELAGHPMPDNVTRALALASAPLAVALAVRTAAGFWRGPALLHFPVEYAVLCQDEEAAQARASAHIRGALGGAGHLHRGRLVFPAVAWLAAAVALGHVAMGAMEMPEFQRALQLLGFAVVARVIFPPRAFWYRERRDGSVVVYPASIQPLLAVRAPRSQSTDGERREASGE